VRASKTDSKFTPHTNVVIRGNYLSQTNAPYGCNTVYLTGVQHAVVERNVTKDAGTSAIEVYNSDDVKVQYNETFGTVQKAGGADSNGIDADRASTATVIQYNYVHDNGDGILLCQFAFGDSIVRYNVLINNKRHGINLHSDSSATNQTYNNLILIDGINSGNLIATSGTASETLAAAYTIRNNILRSSRSAAMVVTGGGVTYSNNLFSGVTAVGSAPQSGDPMFVNSATQAERRHVGAGHAVAARGLPGARRGSPAIDNGVSITATAASISGAARCTCAPRTSGPTKRRDPAPDARFASGNERLQHAVDGQDEHPPRTDREVGAAAIHRPRKADRPQDPVGRVDGVDRRLRHRLEAVVGRVRDDVKDTVAVDDRRRELLAWIERRRAA
jgi:hypothetical protein